MVFGFFKKRTFRKQLQHALEDGTLTQTEAFFLKKRANELDIEQEYVDTLRKQDFAERIRPILERISETRRFSPEDEKQLETLSQQLQIKNSYNDKFKLFRLFWEFDTTGAIPLTPVSTDIFLRKHEECYFQAPSVWKQIKIVKEHLGYETDTATIKITDWWHISSGTAKAVTQEYAEMKTISEGDVHITNKRVILNGYLRTTSITLGRIVHLKLYDDGIEIRKNTGEPDFFFLSQLDAEYIVYLLRTLIQAKA